jgi:adenosylhomocysteinase
VQSLRGQSARVAVTEIDPICALQACMQASTSSRSRTPCRRTDIYVTATGN